MKIQNVEVFAIWTHLCSNNGFISTNQSFCNHTKDRELKKMIKDFTDCLKDENKHLERLLRRKGIILSPSRAVNSDVQLKDGANSTDTGISTALSLNIAASLVTTSKALGQSTSEFPLLMYGHFHMKKAVLGAKLLQLRKDKRWLVITPTTPLNIC